ncbi:MAG TPA: C25 family cysteine peptidase [Bacteroidales bacterium]|nr:C25 family cysteine peptidase [Bacteroidales bacterium]
MGFDRKYILTFLLLANLLPSGAQSERNTDREFPVGIVSALPGQAGSRLDLAYSSGKYTFSQLKFEEGDFIRMEIPGHSYISDPGMPELPVVTKLVDLTGRRVTKISINNIIYERVFPESTGFRGQLIPAQPGQTKQIQRGSGRLIRDRNTYETDKSPLADTVSIKEIGTIRGRDVGIIQINPVIYYPASNYFDIITSMDISIEYVEQSGKTGLKGAYASGSFDNLLEKGLIDFDPDDVIPGFSLKPSGLIILSDTTMKKHLKPLVEWKTKRGFRVTELYVDGNNLQRTFSDIKDTLNYLYNNPTADNPSPEYLIIAGDLNIIPFSDGTSRLSDMYYAEFDGGGDYLPDMFYGRLPATDTIQMKAIVRKIVEYEQFEFPDTSTHYADAVALTGLDAGHISEMNGQMNYAALYLNKANKTNPHIFFHSTVDSIRNAGYDSVKYMLNTGAGFVNYTGHGDRHGWLDTGIDYLFVANMTNSSMYPVIISNACETARYNDSNCFGSTMVRAIDKGALAFIGCSMDSYWNEDFYWAIGASTLTTDPTYEDTGLGFYDRLFHKHDEAPSDWYTSLGQILFAGNLAVSSSTSTLDKYYWETYTLLGDPSITPFIGTPDTFNISLPDTIPPALLAFSVTAEPFAYIAISHFDTLWDASYTSPSGSATLNIPDLPKDSCLIVITGQNMVPLIKTIYFSGSDTAWLNIIDVNTSDPLGNNDGFADYSEEIALSIDIQNAGGQPADDVSLTLSTNSGYFNIAINSINIGTVGSLSQVNLSEAFNMVVADSVPDMEIVTFNLKMYYNLNMVEFTFAISLHGPEPAILNCYIDDQLSGNGNGLPESGESFDVIFRIANQGSSDISGNLLIYNISQYIDFDLTTIPTGPMVAGSVIEVSASASLDAGTPEAQIVSFDVTLDCDPYSDIKILAIVAGRCTEDFESQNFNSFPWINDPDHPWIITDTEKQSNSFAAISGEITNNQESVLSLYLNMPEDDTLKFWYMVSSEKSYDLFMFHVDSLFSFIESGESGWKLSKIPLSKGVHYLEWKYRKDVSYSEGLDAAFIDLVRFPEISFLENDIALNKIISPSVPSKNYQTEIITVELTNLSNHTINDFSLTYSVNDEPVVSEDFSTELVPGDTVEVSFVQSTDLSVEGPYSIEVCRTNPDDYTRNDTVRIQVLSTGLSDIILNDYTFKIMPNPFRDQFTILSNGNFNNTSIEVYNSTGIKLKQINFEVISEGEKIMIPTSGMQPGIYLVVINTGDRRSLYKAIKY